MDEVKPPWPHAPTHQLSVRGTYFVTAGTYLKAHHFRGAVRSRVLHRGLLTVAREFNWQLEAWAVFSNHYHFVAHSPGEAQDAASLPAMLGVLHTKTARWLNRIEGAAVCGSRGSKRSQCFEHRPDARNFMSTEQIGFAQRSQHSEKRFRAPHLFPEKFERVRQGMADGKPQSP